MPTINEVAADCQVSTATVSRVFNRRGTVSEPTRQRVLETAQRLGYSPRITARRDCLAVVVEGFDQLSQGGYHGMLISALTREVSARGYRLEMLPAAELPTLSGKFFHGIISCLYREESLLLLEAGKGIPRVAINSQPQGIPAVCSDDIQGMGLAVAHLVEAGHRRIALLARPGDTHASCARREGFAQAAERHKLAVSGCPVLTIGDEESLMEPVARALKAESTALIVTGEENGPRVSAALNLLRERVPEDRSLITFNHCGISEYLLPAQTALSQDFPALAREALTLLEAGPIRRRIIRIPYSLHVRGSVATIR